MRTSPLEAPMRAAVIGAGSWGTALATVLAHNGHETHVWAHDPEVAESINQRHQNTKYLPDQPLPELVKATHDLHAALRGAELVVSASPSHVTRSLLRD